MNKILELKKISRTYFLDNRPVDIFKDINLTIKSREKIALVGPSGCGKTSLLHIAGLLEAPSSGEVFVRDEKINWSSDNSCLLYTSPSPRDY